MTIANRPPWIFLGLLVGLINAMIVGRFWWAGFGIIYLLIRCLYLGHSKTNLLWLMGIAVLATVWFSYQNVQYDMKTWATIATRQLSLRVEPDQIQITGDTVSIIGVTKEGQRIRAFGHLTSQKKATQLQVIDQPTQWQVNGPNDLLEGPRNRMQFDRRSQLRAMGIHGSMKMAQWFIVKPSQTAWQWPIDLMHHWRKQLLLYFATLPTTLNEYASNLIIGATANDFYTQNSGLKQLGLLHLFSISGMHVVYLVTLCQFILARLGVLREHSQLILAIGLPFYAIIAGGSGTLIRAILIGEASLLQPLLNHKQSTQISGLDMWSLSLIGGVTLQPAVLLTLGGQLSYLLAFALIYVAVEKTWWQTWLMNLVSLPLILHTVFQIHVLSTPVNLLVIPLFGWFIFPLVIIGACLGGVLNWAANITNTVLMVFSGLTNWFGQLPGMVTFGHLSTLFTWVCLLMTLLAIDERRPRVRCKWLIALAIVYGVAFVTIRWPVDGEVSFIDVGQGDSILLRTPFNRHVSLIDTGGKVGFSKPLWARTLPGMTNVEAVTVNYLHSRGISEIDDVNCSHQDADHIGDVGRLLQLMTVHTLTIPAGMRQSRGFQAKIAPYLKQTRVIELTAGRQPKNFPFTIYHPFHPGPGGNEDSVSLGTIRNGVRFLFMGDLDRAGEREILQHYSSLTTDVLKLGHHGSDTSSDPLFIKQVAPKLGIISAGRENRYGHPKQRTLTTLTQNHIVAVNTADAGMISYVYDWLGNGHWQTMLPTRTPIAGSPR